MNYCVECGSRLIMRHLDNEGDIPYCQTCGEFRFPIYSTAVSMIVMNPKRDKILLIRQYGKLKNILVAGYINKGESAEDAVHREVMEEIGIEVSDLMFNKSKYFDKSNTLMINFACVAKTEDLSHMTNEVDHAQWYTFNEAKEAIAPASLAEEFLLHFLGGF